MPPGAAADKLNGESLGQKGPENEILASARGEINTSTEAVSLRHAPGPDIMY
jgi:hypothetical protein